MFFLIFLFGMLKQHERAVSFVKQCERRWNNDSFWRHLQDGRYEEIRKGHLRVSRSPRRRVTSGGRWRREDGDASEALGSRNQWRTGGKIWQNMMQKMAILINHLIPTSPLRFLWRMLHWDFSLARLRLVNWDDTQHPADAGERNAKNNGKRQE